MCLFGVPLMLFSIFGIKSQIKLFLSWISYSIGLFCNSVRMSVLQMGEIFGRIVGLVKQAWHLVLR